MDILNKLDPQVAPGLEVFPAEMYAAIGDDPPLAREMFGELTAAMAHLVPPSEVTAEERTIPGPDVDIPIVIYQPPNEAPRPGLLWIHGGGYIIGSAREDATCNEFAEQVGCTIVSVDYRLTPEATYRQSISDCFAALNWMVNHADELGIDKTRIAIGGNSAGGGLAASLALFNRDNPRAFARFSTLDLSHD